MSELWTTLVSWAAEHVGISALTLEHLILTIFFLLFYFVLRVITFAILERCIKDVPRKYILTKTFSYIYGFAFTFALLVV
jgi:hypothetical protein